MAGHAYDVVQRYRDLGGNLMFLSANNFFRRVDRKDPRLKLITLWRDLGRPESALIGVQYKASDRGTHQSPFVVTDDGAASFAFAGTGLASGAELRPATGSRSTRSRRSRRPEPSCSPRSRTRSARA